MRRIQIGQKYALKQPFKSFKRGDLVTVLNVHSSGKSVVAEMPNGSIQTILVTQIVKYLAPPILELLAEAIKGLLLRVKKWSNKTN